MGPARVAAPAAASLLERIIPLIPMIIGSALLMQTLNSSVVANALPVMARSLHEDPLTLIWRSQPIYCPRPCSCRSAAGSPTGMAAGAGVRPAIVIFSLGRWLSRLGRHTLSRWSWAGMLQGIAAAHDGAGRGRLVLLRPAEIRAGPGMSWLTMPPVWRRCSAHRSAASSSPSPHGGGSSSSTCRSAWPEYVLVSLFIPDVREQTRAPMDWRGFLLSGCGLAGVVYGLQDIGRNGATPSPSWRPSWPAAPCAWRSTAVMPSARRMRSWT